ncbi:MAG: HAMP domain-containing sensor histidine kinase [Melioribacteraceae bacterium]
MQKPIRKISLIILLIFILPIVVFFIYQFASLNETEKEINEIYTQQLEAILYSVNQYSEDVISSWVNDINTILYSTNFQKKNIKNFLRENNSIKSIFVFENTLSNISVFNNSDTKNISKNTIQKILNDKKPLIEKLQNYLEVGYQKIEPLGKFTSNDLYVCLFPLHTKENERDIGGIIFNPSQFIKENLSGKISQTAGDKFVLTILNKYENEILHSTENITIDKILLKKPLWLLPGLSLGIKMKSGSIEELTSQRFYKNLLILASLLLILIIGMGLIYYNLRKELRLTQLKSDFISNVSHELRTPLSLISMYSETLALSRIKDEEKKKEYYSVIHNEANRLSKIVNSVLNFSKIEAGIKKYNFQSYSLLEINNDVLNTYDYHIKSKGFSYTFNSAKKIKNIICDKDAISESIINLIENAIKYSNGKKEFEIIIASNKKGVYWEIKDFGVGIASKDQTKIFDKFYRVSSGLIHNTKGTGLGLSLVKQIMDAHNGDVTVKSSIDIGSTFRLQFNKSFPD